MHNSRVASPFFVACCSVFVGFERNYLNCREQFDECVCVFERERESKSKNKRALLFSSLVQLATFLPTAQNERVVAL